MLYCKKCARILDEDVKQCPICGALDEDETQVFEPIQTQEPETRDIWGTEAFDDLPVPEIQARELDLLFGKDPEPAAPEVVAPETVSSGTLSSDTVSPEIPSPETVSPEPAAPRANAPAPEILEAKPYNAGPRPDVAEPEPFLSKGVKIATALGCALFPPAGIVVAIVFMAGRNTAHRKFGLTLLILMLAEMALGTLCCCALGYSSYAQF